MKHRRAFRGSEVKGLNFKLALLVGLSLFAIVSTTTLVPLADAMCIPGGVYPQCVKEHCQVIVLPRCDTNP